MLFNLEQTQLARQKGDDTRGLRASMKMQCNFLFVLFIYRKSKSQNKTVISFLHLYAYQNDIFAYLKRI